MLLNLDADAKKVAERLDGLPLALATAGISVRRRIHSVLLLVTSNLSLLASARN